MTQLAKIRGAQKVIMIDINDTRLAMVKKFGADEVINSAKVDPIEAVRKLTDGKGADKVISANPSNSLRLRVFSWQEKAVSSYSSAVFQRDL